MADQRSPDLPETTSEAPVAANNRPVRPPVQQTTSEALESTTPGRIQVAAERVWTTAILMAAIGLLTGWLTHGDAVTALAAKATGSGSDAEHREAAALLHTATLVCAAVGVLLEAILVAFLRRRLVVLRVFLTMFALASIVLLSLVLDVAIVPGWRGWLIAGTLGLHGLLATVGSVLMWLPAGRRAAT